MVALPFYHVTLRTSKPKSRKYPKVLVTAGDHLRKRRLDLGLEQHFVASLLQVCTSCNCLTLGDRFGQRIIPKELD